MITKKVEKALNEQIKVEEHSSRLYMSMASWCEANGFPGAAAFLYQHSDEERFHMSKMIKFLNNKGGYAVLESLENPAFKFTSLKSIFEDLLKHELFVSGQINNLYELTFKEKDFTTGQFLQWYIQEQIEEESLVRGIMDKFTLIGDQPGALYLLDKEFQSLSTQGSAPVAQPE
jgi:ferritin